MLGTRTPPGGGVSHNLKQFMHVARSQYLKEIRLEKNLNRELLAWPLPYTALVSWND